MPGYRDHGSFQPGYWNTQEYFQIQILGAVIIFSFSTALALRKPNFGSRNIGH